jgi:hypothetical protein
MDSDTTPAAEQPRFACAVCRRYLQPYELTTVGPDGPVVEVQYLHGDEARGAPVDHEAVPAPATPETTGYCDFCATTSGLDWIIVTRFKMSLLTVSGDGSSSHEHLDNGTWGCCAVCARLVKKGRRPGRAGATARAELVNRGVYGVRRRQVDTKRLRDERRSVQDLHTAFWLAEPGEPVRLPDDWDDLLRDPP